MTGVRRVTAWADTHHLASQTESNRARSDWGCPHSSAMSLAETGFLSTRTGLSLAVAVLSVIKAPEGILLFPLEKGLDELCETCHSKTVFSLRSHQIFTMLSYSRLAVWQKCIMWTSCGWRGYTGSCNNRAHSKIETNQMYQQEINNWKLLILVLSAPQSSARKQCMEGVRKKCGSDFKHKNFGYGCQE